MLLINFRKSWIVKLWLKTFHMHYFLFSLSLYNLFSYDTSWPPNSNNSNTDYLWITKWFPLMLLQFLLKLTIPLLMIYCLGRSSQHIVGRLLQFPTILFRLISDQFLTKYFVKFFQPIFDYFPDQFPAKFWPFCHFRTKSMFFGIWSKYRQKISVDHRWSE